MIDLKALLLEEKNMGKNAHASYKTAVFQDVDKSLEAMRSDEKRIEMRETALNMLRDNSDSIILNYVAGKVKLMLRPHESNIMLCNPPERKLSPPSEKISPVIRRYAAFCRSSGSGSPMKFAVRKSMMWSPIVPEVPGTFQVCMVMWS